MNPFKKIIPKNERKIFRACFEESEFEKQLNYSFNSQDEDKEDNNKSETIDNMSAVIKTKNGTVVKQIPAVFNSKVVIGREDFQKVDQDDNIRFISGKHLEINFNGKRFTVKDLNSTNGTSVNGDKLGSGGEVTLVHNTTYPLILANVECTITTPFMAGQKVRGDNPQEVTPDEKRRENERQKAISLKEKQYSNDREKRIAGM